MKISTAFLCLLFALPTIAHAEDAVVATLNGENITDSQIAPRIKNSMMKVMAQTYEIKRDAIDELIDSKLLEQEAKKRGIASDALIKAEVDSKVTPPTDEEARAMYEVYKQRFGNKTYEEVAPMVKSQLVSQKKQKLYGEFLGKLRKVAKLTYKIERPSVAVSMDDDARIGNPSAPIQIIEFTDYQCPFCKKARPNINQVIDTYKDKVVYVLRDFPLSLHKFAKGAANAAQCAGEQGKYFEFSNKIWDNQQDLSEGKFKSYATEIGLDIAKFSSCSTSNKYFKEIDKDQADGAAAGVTGTPAYFINGKFLSGAQPFEAFKQIIDEELSKLGK